MYVVNVHRFEKQWKMLKFNISQIKKYSVYVLRTTESEWRDKLEKETKGRRLNND